MRPVFALPPYMTKIFATKNAGLPLRYLLVRLGEAECDLANLREPEVVVSEHDRVRHAHQTIGRNRTPTRACGATLTIMIDRRGFLVLSAFGDRRGNDGGVFGAVGRTGGPDGAGDNAVEVADERRRDGGRPRWGTVRTWTYTGTVPAKEIRLRKGQTSARSGHQQACRRRPACTGTASPSSMRWTACPC